AIGRNIPMLLSWNKNGGLQMASTGTLSMIEPRVLAFANARSCLGTDWVNPVVVQEITRIDVGNNIYDTYQTANVDFLDENGATSTTADICFSGRGRTYIRTNGGAFAPLNGVPQMRVTNSGSGSTGRIRTVFIPPNGMARLAE